MSIMDSIFSKAKADPKRVAFPEANDTKMLQAIKECVDAQICKPYLVGNPIEIEETAKSSDISLAGMTVVDVTNEAWLDSLIDRYVAQQTLNSAKTMKRKSKDSLFIALMMQAVGDVDCSFAGLTHSTGDVISAGEFVVGLQEGVSTVSSVGIFNVPGYEGSEGQLLAFGDSAVCVEPDSKELAGIAIAACDTVGSLLGWEPRCALLSYSTDGSAEHHMVDKVRDAITIAKNLRPDLHIDGEFQLDTAINPAVAAKKTKRESAVAGKANIIIWPDLNVGNIGVKLVQQFAKADAYGPMLQGFASVVGDCSRAAPVSELVGNIAMSVVRSQRGE